MIGILDINKQYTSATIMKVLSNLSKPVYVMYTGYLKYDLIEVGSFTRNTKTPRVSDLLGGI